MRSLLVTSLAGRLNQNLEDFKRAAADRDEKSMCSQFTPGEINPPLARLVH
jgi:hypothetical protein